MKVWKLFTLYSFIHTGIAIILLPISLTKEEEEFWRRH